MCDAIAATGALEAARSEALRMVAEAKAELPALPEPSQQAALELGADGVLAPTEGLARGFVAGAIAPGEAAEEKDSPREGGSAHRRRR